MDVEAGEKDELLDKEGKESSDSNKKEDGDELEEVKVRHFWNLGILALGLKTKNDCKTQWSGRH